MCHNITCKGYERNKFIHGSKERFKDQYPPANINEWIRYYGKIAGMGAITIEMLKYREKTDQIYAQDM